MTKTFDLAVLPGDGIGNETVPEGLKVLDAIAADHRVGGDGLLVAGRRA